MWFPITGSFRNVYCCAVLASLLSRHKLSYCAHSPRQKKTPQCAGSFKDLLGQFFYLVEAQLHWRVATEDGHEHRELLGGGLNVGDDSCHGGERTVGDGDLIANGVNAIHVYSMNKPDVAAQIQANLSEIL